MTRTVAVGDFAYLPLRLPRIHPGYQLAADIASAPGRVVSIENGWAIVDRGSWGQFGCPVADLRPAPLHLPTATAGQ